MQRLQGKVAVITGGNSGIGLASACLFAKEGAQVIVTARRQDVLDDAVRQIGHGAIGIKGDVASLEHHADVAGQVREQFGALDIYMANAGVITLTPNPAYEFKNREELLADPARMAAGIEDALNQVADTAAQLLR